MISRVFISILAFTLICVGQVASQEKELQWKFPSTGVSGVEDKQSGLTFFPLQQGVKAAFKKINGVTGAVVILPGERVNEQERKADISQGIDPDRKLTAIAFALVLPLPADTSDTFVSKEDWNGSYVFRWKAKNGAEVCVSDAEIKPYSDTQDVFFIGPCLKPDKDVIVVTRNGETPLKGYEDYIPRTMRQIIKQHSDSGVLDRSSIMLTGDTFSSRVKCIYAGQTRKILPEKKAHLDMLVKTFNVDQKVIDQYDTEVLFLEGSDQHWLPLNQKLLSFMEKEVKKGYQLTLYLEWVGAKKIDKKWEWIFMVNEFDKD